MDRSVPFRQSRPPYHADWLSGSHCRVTLQSRAATEPYAVLG